MTGNLAADVADQPPDPRAQQPQLPMIAESRPSSRLSGRPGQQCGFVA
jgi:hypothetical protein